MIRSHRGPEFRLVIPGRGYSFRTQAATSYKRRIRRIARGVFPSPTSSPVEISIDYFHSSPRRFDLDNLAKCIIDALSGIAYLDDKQVRRHITVGHNLRTSVIIHDSPVDLVKPLRRYSDYVFIRVKSVSA